MKTLIIGAGPLGSLYAYLLHKAGKEVTLLARNDHYIFLKDQGLMLTNEFSKEKITTKEIHIVDGIDDQINYDLIIVIMRKNSVKSILPTLAKINNFKHILFMGNNSLGFDEYLQYIPKEKILFGFPGGGGSRINHIVHYIDSDKPNGKRMPIVLGELDGKKRDRTNQIAALFESSHVPVKYVDDIDSWQKYHVAFVLPIAGALLKSGDNYTLAKDKKMIKTYIYAVREGGKVLKSLGYHKSYNPKFTMFYWLPVTILVGILGKVLNTKFSEIAMMMHVHAARDEMIELSNEFQTLMDLSPVKTPNLCGLLDVIRT